MIIDGSRALLVVSIDTLPSDVKNKTEYVSISGAKVPEAEQMALDEAFQLFNLSDIPNKGLRIPIPIDERILPIIQTGTDSRATADTTRIIVGEKDEQKTIFTPSRDTMSLSFRMKSQLGAVSTIADILNALSLISSIYPVYCSWFSKTDCIIDARLIGIGRSSEKNSDMEALTLTLERARTVESESTPEAEEIILENTAGQQVYGYAEASLDQILEGWSYYDLGELAELIKQPVPYVELPFTVQRQTVELFLIKTMSAGVGRDMQGVRWLGQMVTLEAADPVKYAEGLALLRYAGRLVMGVPL